MYIGLVKAKHLLSSKNIILMKPNRSDAE